MFRPGNVLLVVILLGTIACAIWTAGAHPWTGGPGPLLNFLGRLAGVAGMVLLLLATIVSIRIPRFDQPFGGITQLWKVHHVLGLSSLLLLMAHPLLLAFSRLPASPHAAAGVLWPPRDAVDSWIGWAALLAMMAFLIPTFSIVGRRYYQLWKAVHAVSAAAVVLGIVHTLMFARTVPVWLWWALSAAAAVALMYRLVLRKIRPGQRFTVSAVTPLTDDVVELSLVPEHGPVFTYWPGQFIYLSPLDPDIEAGYREEHPYTISSAPSEAQLRTGIKALGDASTALQHVQPGTGAYVDGPYGRFFDPNATGAELWIGGGIGITPFVGRARSLLSSDSTPDIHLVYCANEVGRAYYLDELQSIAEAVPGFAVTGHYYYEEGSINRAWLAERIPDFAQRTVYICGPGPLIDVVHSICREAGVPRRKIHSEAFTFL